MEEKKRQLILGSFFAFMIVLSFLAGAFTSKMQMQDLTEYYFNELVLCHNATNYKSSNTLTNDYQIPTNTFYQNSTFQKNGSSSSI